MKLRADDNYNVVVDVEEKSSIDACPFSSSLRLVNISHLASFPEQKQSASRREQDREREREKRREN